MLPRLTIATLINLAIVTVLSSCLEISYKEYFGVGVFNTT
jgi:hypothetical protein